MTSTLPQFKFFENSFSLPGTSWKLTGHSRAMEKTGFLLTGGGAKIALDAGVDIPGTSTLDMILLTHSHIDHCNALPLLYRYSWYIIFELILFPSSIRYCCV